MIDRFDLNKVYSWYSDKSLIQPRGPILRRIKNFWGKWNIRRIFSYWHKAGDELALGRGDHTGPLPSRHIDGTVPTCAASSTLFKYWFIHLVRLSPARRRFSIHFVPTKFTIAAPVGEFTMPEASLTQLETKNSRTCLTFIFSNIKKLIF